MCDTMFYSYNESLVVTGTLDNWFATVLNELYSHIPVKPCDRLDVQQCRDHEGRLRRFASLPPHLWHRPDVFCEPSIRDQESVKAWMDINVEATFEIIATSALDTSGVSSLTSLSLTSCDMEDLDMSIGQCNLLQHLGLRANNLESLPMQLGACEEFEVLVVALPEEIGYCRNLRELDVTVKALTSLPRSLGQCSNLQELVI